MVFNIGVRTWSAVVVATAMVVAGCSSTSVPKTSAGVVRVVAGENFWGDIVHQLGGSHVSVTSIISDPNADPHTYESNAKDAAAIAKARVVIVNGLGYDDFLSKLISASGSPNREVVSAATAIGISGDDANPHIWYDTSRLHLVVSAVADALGRADPSDARLFTANAATFDDSLKPIMDVISTIRSKYSGTEIAYTERVPGYLVQAAGLALGIPSSFARAIEDGDDPSAGDTEAFDTAITDRRVKVLLYNAQVTDAQTDKIKALAQQSQVPIVGVTETLPSSDADFQAWQLRQANELLAALGG